VATRNYNSDRSDYMTPLPMIEPILNFLGRKEFDIDVCCTKKNIPAHFRFTKKEDGLKQNWAGKCFLNPEFKYTRAWIKKTILEVMTNGCEVWCVLPIDRFYVDYYHDYILNNHNCVFGILKGKQGFIIPGEEEKDPVPSVGIMIACFSQRAAEIEYCWNMQKLFGVKAFIGGFSS